MDFIQLSFEKYSLLAGSKAQNSSPYTHYFNSLSLSLLSTMHVLWYKLIIMLYFY